MKVLGVVCASLSLVWAACAEELPVRGRHLHAGAYHGVIRLVPEADGLRVAHRLEFADGRELLLAGFGRREGTSVEASLRAAQGITTRLEDPLLPPGESLELRLVTSPEGDRWRVTLSSGGRTVSRASGSRSEQALEVLTDPAALAGASADGKPDGAAAEGIGLGLIEGVPFIAAPEDGRDIHDSDPRQGGLGDCYLIAALIATARNKPELIRSMIAPREEGSWEVTLKDVGVFWIDLHTGREVQGKGDSRQLVDRSFPTVRQGETFLPAYAQFADQESDAEGTIRYELWPMLIEKAFAQFKGGYERIEGGNPVTVYDFIGGAGKSRWFRAKDQGTRGLSATIDAALRAGKPVTVAIPDLRGKNGQLGQRLNLVGSHAYVLLERRGGGYVLFNPWGGSHPTRALTPAELVQLGVEVQVAGF